MKRVLVCGSRHWSNYKLNEEKLRLLPSTTTIIHGDCRGADKLAGGIARRLGMSVRIFPEQVWSWCRSYS